MIKLSIIVPVYNVEEYLAKCLDSIFSQDVDEKTYEIIIVNDGSTDKSLEIAESYHEKICNLKIISQENIGLGGARNTALRVANGKYVLFLDSDDYLEPKSLKSCLSFLKSVDLDVLRFNYNAVNENHEIIPKKKNSLHTIKFSSTPVDGKEFLAYHLGWGCYVWQFIIRRGLLIENDFFFNETIYYEDMEWTTRVLLKAKRVASLEVKVYNYLQRKGSISRSINLAKLEKVYRDKVFILDFLESIYNENDEIAVKKWCKGIQGLLIIGMFPFVKSKLPTYKKELITLISNYNYRPLRPFRYTLKQLRDAILINISPHLFYVLKGSM